MQSLSVYEENKVVFNVCKVSNNVIDPPFRSDNALR